jgi:hypothetical protein
MDNFTNTIAAIHKMNGDQLNQLVQAIKDRRNFLTRQKAVTFAVGDLVSFAARGMQVLGTVTKINVKTVQVRQNNSHTVWKVHASLLSPVQQMETGIKILG